MKSERLKMKNEKWLTQWFCVALIFFFHFSFFTSCSRDNLCDTPFGDGAAIDIYQPDFAALLSALRAR